MCMSAGPSTEASHLRSLKNTKPFPLLAAINRKQPLCRSGTFCVCSHPRWKFEWFDFGQAATASVSSQCSGLVMSKGHFHSSPLQPLPLSLLPVTWQSVIQMPPLWLSAPESISLLSAFWVDASLRISHCPLRGVVSFSDEDRKMMAKNSWMYFQTST